jgi:hypothetical protein
MFFGLPDSHPDPVRDTYPRIRNRTKMSRIRNTGFQDVRTLIDKKIREDNTIVHEK